MKVASLFSGIGGLELGLRAAGHETLSFCEIAEPAVAVLAEHFANVPCWRDVTTLPSLRADVEVVAAGFPCQDLSQAGLTAGIDGRRSSLVGHVFRLLDQRRVPWIILENVSFMLHLAQGKALDTLVSEFESRGYRWAYRVVSSLAFLPQRRERILFVTTTTDIDPADVLLTDDVLSPPVATSLATHAHGFYWTEGIRGLGWARDAIPTLKNGSTIGIPSPPAILLPNGEVVTPDIRDAERLQGFPADWTLAAVSVGRASARWSLCGNAVSVPVADWLGGRLAAPGRFDSARECPISGDGRWPKAARFDGHRRRAVQIGMFPTWAERPSLLSFLKYPGKLLSAKATRGFLSRTEQSTLRFPSGFQDRLRAHLARMEAARPTATSDDGVNAIAAE